jgi:hypothetical protein
VPSGDRRFAHRSRTEREGHTIDRQTPAAPSDEWSSPQAAGREAASPRLAGAERPPSQIGPDLVEAVLSSIRTAGRPLSRTEILASTGISDTLWTPVIQELRSSGLVVSSGKKRGTTWGLVGWTSPMIDGD